MTVRPQLLHYELEQAGIPVYSVRADGLVIYNDVLTPEQQALAAQIIAAHDPTKLLPWEQDELDAQEAKVDFRNLPQWSTWSPQQASDYVQGNILNGMDKAAIDAWIDANVTTLATAKNALKLLAEAIVDTRTIMKNIAIAVIYFREIVVRRS